MISPGQIDPLLSQLDGDGFVIIEDACDAGFIERLSRVCRERSRAIRDALGDREIGIGSAAGYDEIVQRSPGRWDVPISPAEFGVDDRDLPWWPLVTAVLGDDAEHSFSGVVYSDPGSPAQYWHIDSPHESADHLPAHALNVLLALHDIPLAMGPTEFARGSHRLTNHLRNPALGRDELVYQHETTNPVWLVDGTGEAPPESVSKDLVSGTAAMFDDRLLHRGLSNGSDEIRRVAYFSYRRAGYAENTHFESKRSVFDS